MFSVYLTRIGGKHNVVIAQIIGDEIKCEEMQECGLEMRLNELK